MAKTKADAKKALTNTARKVAKEPIKKDKSKGKSAAGRATAKQLTIETSKTVSSQQPENDARKPRTSSAGHDKVAVRGEKPH